MKTRNKKSLAFILTTITVIIGVSIALLFTSYYYFVLLFVFIPLLLGKLK